MVEEVSTQLEAESSIRTDEGRKMPDLDHNFTILC